MVEPVDFFVASINNENSCLGFKKTYNLLLELWKVRHLPGDTAEVGCYRGGTSRLIRLTLPTADRSHFVYDTFCGIQGANSEHDQHQNGEFSCSLEEVLRNINLTGVEYKVGMFPDTFGESDRKFVFVHSDTDTYLGTKGTLEKFADCMVTGGRIMLDDYQWVNCQGVEKAVLEFLDTRTDFELIVLDNTWECSIDKTKINQAVLIKR